VRSPSDTEDAYIAAVSLVLAHIQTRLDNELTPHSLADVACFSPHHFHRIFRAVVGESVMDHVRRLRLERAAYRLKTSQTSVGAVALDAGYAAQETFTRIFQAYYGLGPRAFRRGHFTHLLPSVSGVHYAPNGFTPLKTAAFPELLQTNPPDAICPAHQAWCQQFESPHDQLLELATTLANIAYPKERTMSNPTTKIDKEIDALQTEVEAAKQRLLEARKRRPAEPVKDYALKDAEGREVMLSDLFGDKEDLILVHNMGTGCSYCTMWADGFTGLAPHLSDRAAFVLGSPDTPDVLKRFAAKRNWNFKLVSAHDSPFLKDMGFWQEDGPNPGPWPGVSTFKKDAEGNITRIAKSHFGPGDDFCPVWPLLDLLDQGANGWEPQYFYTDN
jgi:predicted dithiol-disulfide oxidoreductase (DUF899 family)/AraC-like DNA-binding protein